MHKALPFHIGSTQLLLNICCMGDSCLSAMAEFMQGLFSGGAYFSSHMTWQAMAREVTPPLTSLFSCISFEGLSNSTIPGFVLD